MIDRIKKSKLRDITEYGRAEHAEMAAILSCAKNGISLKGAHLYCTTFPCHNCAKHIISAGIKEVIFIEPYPKSKAIQLHGDSIDFGVEQRSEKIVFKPFVGVGPRRFFDLFSISLGSGKKLERKVKETGDKKNWDSANAALRIQLLPQSYLEREKFAVSILEDIPYIGEENDGEPIGS